MATLAITVFLLLLFNIFPSQAHLSATFYNTTCPDVASMVRACVQEAVAREKRMAASIIRLHFHDCFVQGCDASILLDETVPESERTAVPNRSLRGFEVIEAIKQRVEQACPGVISCADILTLAARDASVAVGGPSWNVSLGRRDSTTANLNLAKADIPLASADLDTLIGSFRNKDLSVREMVALSGSHTIGQAQCSAFRIRIYNGTNIDPDFASNLKHQCPETGGDTNLAPFDFVTPNDFDNNYFTNLLQEKGLLTSDQALFSGGPTDAIVSEYSKDPQVFASDFAKAMVKMGEISPLLGDDGIIRETCCIIKS